MTTLTTEETKTNTDQTQNDKSTVIREYDFDPTLKVEKLAIHQDPFGKWSGGIGATVWDSGIVLAKYLEAHSHLIKQKSVLEIGAGTGLCGMVCAKLKAKAVLFTDKDCALPLLNKNLFENFLQIAPQQMNQKNKESNDCKQQLLLSKELTWGDSKQLTALQTFINTHFLTFETMFDVIILSDCICWKELHEPLLDTLQAIVAYISKHNKKASIPSILMSYEIRNEQCERNFFKLLEKRNWKYEQLKLDNVDPMYICDELVVYSISASISISK
mmetsp:Transcript_48674/g.80740  ORF Transcript_48674/g.80740 Transcript_48674/m.80740 type:complete len:273 (-) Transcript_48674:8-826(-)